MKLHTLAEREFDGAAVDALPAFGQARDRLHTLEQIATDQAFIDEGEGALADIRLFAQRFQRGAVGNLLNRNGDGRAVIGLRDGEARQDQGAGSGTGARQKMTTMNKHGFPSMMQSRVRNRGETLGRCDDRPVTRP